MQFTRKLIWVGAFFSFGIASASVLQSLRAEERGAVSTRAGTANDIPRSSDAPSIDDEGASGRRQAMGGNPAPDVVVSRIGGFLGNDYEAYGVVGNLAAFPARRQPGWTKGRRRDLRSRAMLGPIKTVSGGGMS